MDIKGANLMSLIKTWIVLLRYITTHKDFMQSLQLDNLDDDKNSQDISVVNKNENMQDLKDDEDTDSDDESIDTNKEKTMEPSDTHKNINDGNDGSDGGADHVSLIVSICKTPLTKTMHGAQKVYVYDKCTNQRYIGWLKTAKYNDMNSCIGILRELSILKIIHANPVDFVCKPIPFIINLQKRKRYGIVMFNVGEIDPQDKLNQACNIPYEKTQVKSISSIKNIDDKIDHLKTFQNCIQHLKSIGISHIDCDLGLTTNHNVTIDKNTKKIKMFDMMDALVSEKIDEAYTEARRVLMKNIICCEKEDDLKFTISLPNRADFYNYIGYTGITT